MKCGLKSSKLSERKGCIPFLITYSLVLIFYERSFSQRRLNLYLNTVESCCIVMDIFLDITFHKVISQTPVTGFA